MNWGDAEKIKERRANGWCGEPGRIWPEPEMYLYRLDQEKLAIKLGGIEMVVKQADLRRLILKLRKDAV